MDHGEAERNTRNFRFSHSTQRSSDRSDCRLHIAILCRRAASARRLSTTFEICAVSAPEPAFTATRPGHYLIDMNAIARQRLQSVGVTRVFGGQHCTIGDIRFYSHRREQRTGRMASLIWLA